MEIISEALATIKFCQHPCIMYMNYQIMPSLLPWDGSQFLVCLTGHFTAFGSCLVHFRPEWGAADRDIPNRNDQLSVQGHLCVELLDKLEKKWVFFVLFFYQTFLIRKFPILEYINRGLHWPLSRLPRSPAKEPRNGLKQKHQNGKSLCPRQVFIFIGKPGHGSSNSRPTSPLPFRLSF